MLSVLKKYRYDGLFGLDRRSEYEWAETKIGEASVVVPSHGGESFNQNKFVAVSFAFDKDTPTFRVQGKCGKGEHKHSSKPKPK